MAQITIDNKIIPCTEQETVLDALLKHNVQIPHGCLQGVCQSCLMVSQQTPPSLAQMGLKDTLKQQNYFLACQCHPSQNMSVKLPNAQNAFFSVQVIKKQLFTDEIVRLVVHYEQPFSFFAGQFVNLKRSDGLTRSYSIANPPRINQRLEFHIRRVPHGQFSSWLFDKVQIGATLELSHALGNCYYLPGRADQPLLLIGTGTGLAPLYGILYDALAQGHTGEILLYHGSSYRTGLYLVDELRALASKFENLHYFPCLSREQLDGFKYGRAHDVALSQYLNLKNWRIYLCGHPDMVNEGKRSAYLKGASLQNIYADPFLS